MEGNRIGIVGGGQLGRMLTEAAKPMGFEVAVVDPTEYPCPAAQAGAEQINGNLDDEMALLELARVSDVVTWEIEHIPANLLMELDQRHHDIQPSPYDLSIIQDKLEQKLWLKRSGLPVGEFYPINTPQDLEAAIDKYGSCVVKARHGGYDGRGNLVVDTADWETVVSRFPEVKLYAEKLVPIQKELSVIIARDKSRRLAVYPIIETIQEGGQCSVAVAPARIEPNDAIEAKQIAIDTLDHMDGAGVFAIEMFLTTDNRILINEIAPRVHNSGHLTMEANYTSQFAQHVRAISGLPLGNPELISPAAMVNILGERDGPVNLAGLEKVMAQPNAYVHIYGKTPTKIARKMGHITVLAETANHAAIVATKLRRELSI